MNGAQALIRTLVDADVDVCFTNPGTSEMHFVAALDSVPEMRATLVRKWQGWPLKAYQARLDNAGKTMVSVKTRPASTHVKGTAKPAVHRQ